MSQSTFDLTHRISYCSTKVGYSYTLNEMVNIYKLSIKNGLKKVKNPVLLHRILSV